MVTDGGHDKPCTTISENEGGKFFFEATSKSAFQIHGDDMWTFTTESEETSIARKRKIANAVKREMCARPDLSMS